MYSDLDDYTDFYRNDTFHVSYNGNGNTAGSAPVDANTYYNGDTVTVPGAGSLVRTGYTFSSWNTADDGSGTEYDPLDTFLMGAGNVTLYAQWTGNDYTITFDPDGGSGIMAPQTIPCGSTASITANAFTRAGYVFDGWAVTPGGAVVYGDGDPYTMGAGNITLYAQWVNQPGTLDLSFDPGTGANHNVYSIALQPDGKILIGGGFTLYDGVSRNRIARLNADGTLDLSFDPGTGANINVWSIALQPDGKIMIGGDFDEYDGVSRNRIARLNADGSLDFSFDPGTGANSGVSSIVLQPDGKIVIGGGHFTSYDGVSRNRIARLNADGSLDLSFDPGTGANNNVDSIALQPDGKILIGGFFTSYDGVSRNRIARLNADGSLDLSFDPGTGANEDVSSIALQPDGKILIGGVFTLYDGVSRNDIARLNNDGSLDLSFDPGTGANNYVSSIALQPDGKILIGGDFDEYDGVSRNNIARINDDGSLDLSFDPGTGANEDVSSIALQTDGMIVIGGEFTSYNGVSRGHIARIYP